MAATGKQYTMTASAATLTAALGASSKIWARMIEIRAGAANAENIYFGASNVTNVPANAWGYLDAGEAWNSGASYPHGLNTDDIYVVGTANDIAHIFINKAE